jgi:predicted PurR-regulated permease PerM
MPGRGEHDRFFSASGTTPGAGGRGGVASSTGRSPAPWSAIAGIPASAGDGRLMRTVAVTFLGTVAVLALYFGSAVLIPTAVAVLLAFILNPVVTWLRRLLPLPLAVAVALVAALASIAVLTVLVMTQLAEVAGSVTGYQANLRQKVQDVRRLAEGSGPVGQFLAMAAGLAKDLSAEASAAAPPLRVQTSDSGLSSIVAFVAPLLHPVLSIGIVVVLALFILLDRDHLSDKLVRLFGADVHATSTAVSDAAARIARVLSLQVLTNLGFAVLVAASLFALGMPNALLWGLLAGAFRFVPYVGAILGALLPTLIAIAVMPGWLQPFLVLAVIVALDILVGQLVEPLVFGESTGLTPLALILSAIFWGMLWGPIGLLLSTPLTICLLVLGTHVPQLQFLRVLLGDEPALQPCQQIYRRLIRGAIADAAAVTLKVIEDKGPERGLDESLGRMVVLAERDRALGRLAADQTAAIIDGTDQVLEFLMADSDEDEDPGRAAAPELEPGSAPERNSARYRTLFHCIGGRGEIDDAAAAVIAYTLRRRGLPARDAGHADVVPAAAVAAPATNDAVTLPLLCYASHPSQAVLRYNVRKLRGGAGRARHAIIDYDVAPAPALPPGLAGAAGEAQLLVGDIAAICQMATQHAVEMTAAMSRLDA